MFVLKQLRRKKKINQTDLANAIGVSLRTIQLYEKKNANIPIKNLTKIAHYFEVTIAELYSHEVNEEAGIYESKSRNSGYLIESINAKKHILTIPLVTSENYKEYCKDFQNQKFLNALHRISFMVEDIVEGSYLAFEAIGNSMESEGFDSIPNGSVVLGKEVSKEEVGTVFGDKNSKAIIIYQDSILFKEITSYNADNETFTCHSLNASPEYSDFKIPLDEVKQIFKIIKKQTN